jgi:hypothetical protein
MLSWEQFKGITAEEWMQKALSDLKGKVQEDQLQSRFGGEITLSPFLTEGTKEANAPIKVNRIRPGIQIRVVDEKSANDKIQEVLQRGADVLWLECPHPIDLLRVLDGVYLDMIQTFVYTPQESVYETLRDQLNTNLQHFYMEGHIALVHEHTSSAFAVIPANQTLSERLQHFVSVCLPLGKSGKKVCLHVEPTSDFLLQSAELRAFRHLWTQASLPDATLLIFSCITDQHLEKTELHAMIPASYLILSAQFGMSDFLLDNLNNSHSELSRLILNAQHIFQYESGVSNVLDPFAGSYLIEKLTEKLIFKANTPS